MIVVDCCGNELRVGDKVEILKLDGLDGYLGIKVGDIAKVSQIEDENLYCYNPEWKVSKSGFAEHPNTRYMLTYQVKKVK